MSRKDLIDEATMTEPLMALLAIAEGLFAEYGYAGTSVRQIAKGAKVNMATVNYYFGSKERLYNLIFTLRLHSLRKELEQVLDSRNEAEKLEAFLDAYIAHILDNKNFHRLMLREYSLLSSSSLDSSNIKEQVIENLTTLQHIVEGQARLLPNLKIDTTLLCVNIIVLTPRLVLENKPPFNLIEMMDGTNLRLPIGDRIKNYFYSQLFEQESE